MLTNFWPLLTAVREQLVTSVMRGFIGQVHRLSDLAVSAENIRRPDDFDYWSTFGRHYGLQVQNLDWTKDPFIAAFFAFYGVDPQQNFPAAVWTIRAQPIASALRRLEPIGGVARDAAQSAVQLKIAGIGFDFESALASDGSLSDLTCWCIEADCKDEFLGELGKLGITYTGVYPDLAETASTGRELERAAQLANSAKAEVLENIRERYEAQWHELRHALSSVTGIPEALAALLPAPTMKPT